MILLTLLDIDIAAVWHVW